MKIKCSPNKLNDKEGFIELSGNITTLIGGNGSGKSTILQSIFSQYIDTEEYKTICFSSGHNELFSNIFNKHKAQNKRLAREDDNEIKSFYFNKDWIRVLIFFSSALIPNGQVRKYLLENKYILETDGKDLSSTLTFKLSIYKYYLKKISAEYEEEKKGIFNANLYRKTIAHRYLEKLIMSKIDADYDFLDNPRMIYGRRIQFRADEVHEIFGKNINEIFTFLFHANSYYDFSVNSYGAELFFQDDLEFEELSDGEYQLLAFYAMIDLFDSPETIFLFDEIDSHLHFSNIKNIWSAFRGVSGNVITSTHNLESIIQNNFEDIRYIEGGTVKDDLKPKEIISKIQTLSSQQEFEIQIAGRIQNIALIDDEIDWLIFKKLAVKKIGVSVKEVLDKIVPIKRESSFNTANEIFGKSKLLFAKELKEKSGECITKNIFLICDRDKLPLTEIKNNLQVNIHKDFNIFKEASFKTYLLSWKRLEIENYLLHKDLILGISDFEHLNFQRLNFDKCEDICIFDAKPILKPYYKDPEFSEEKLDELIKKIPIDEISVDIEKMYTFISSKIQ